MHLAIGHRARVMQPTHPSRPQHNGATASFVKHYFALLRPRFAVIGTFAPASRSISLLRI
jgi:hypothetical protein